MGPTVAPPNKTKPNHALKKSRGNQKNTFVLEGLLSSQLALPSSSSPSMKEPQSSAHQCT